MAAKAPAKPAVKPATGAPEAGGADTGGNGNGGAGGDTGSADAAAKATRSVSLKKPNTGDRAHTFIIFAAVGSAGIIIIGRIRGGAFPPARQLLALGFVFAGLAMASAVLPGLAGAFALLVFLGVVLKLGLPAFEGISAAAGDKSKLVGTAQPGPDSSQSTVGDTSGAIVGQQASPKAARAVRFALAARGTPYVRGGTSRQGYDCSGLTYMAYRAAGVDITRTSESQYAAGFPSVAWGMWAPGDLIFSQWPGDDASPGHVVMYVGDAGGKHHQCVAAPHTGATVELEDVSTFAAPHYVGSCRPAPSPVHGHH